MAGPLSHHSRGLLNLVAEIESRLIGRSLSPGLDPRIAELVPEGRTYVLILFDGLGVAILLLLLRRTQPFLAPLGTWLCGVALSFFDESGEETAGHLRLQDLYDLTLRADLVTLSACETALGQEVRGEGLMGLTRGFFHAGAARVLASLWSIDDRTTAVFMSRLYEEILRHGRSPAEALAATQRELATGNELSEPYQWGGLVLQGEWW